MNIFDYAMMFRSVPTIDVLDDVEYYCNNDIDVSARAACDLLCNDTSSISFDIPNHDYWMVHNIKKIIFNERTTIILWKNGEKTVTKCLESDASNYSKTKGFLIGYYQYVCKHVLGVSKTRSMEYLNYIVSDGSMEHKKSCLDYKINKVIFNRPATILMWNDKEKVVSKCSNLDIYDKETGFLMCFFKLFSGISSGRELHDFLINNVVSVVPEEGAAVIESLKKKIKKIEKEHRGLNITVSCLSLEGMFGYYDRYLDVAVTFKDLSTNRTKSICKIISGEKITDEIFKCSEIEKYAMDFLGSRISDIY